MSLKVVDNPAESTLAPYEWGKVLNFGVRGNATTYCKSGWSEPEAGLIWTNSANSRLSFAVTPPTADVTLVLNCAPFVAKGVVDQQELHLYVNFLRIQYLTITGESSLEITIPKYALAQPECHIDFFVPSARSPFELGLNPDIRCLGLAMSRLVMIQG